MKNFFLTLFLTLMSLSGFSQTPIFGTVSITDLGYDPNGYIVTPGGALYMAAGNYFFNPGRGIEVATNGYLQLDGPDLLMGCSSGSSTDYWAGVTAYGSTVAYSTTNTMAENWGIVSKHNLIIERAETGLYMRYELGNYNGLTNSIDMVGNGYARSILTYNGNNICKFSDNKKYDIRIHNNGNTDNYSASGSGASSSWKNYYFNSTSSSFVTSMEINNTNLVRVIDNFEIHSSNDGIYLNNSNFSMTDSKIYASSTIWSSGIIHRILTNNLMSTTLKNSSISVYKYGVYTRDSESIYIGSNEIKSVEHGVYAQGTEEAQIMHNKFYNSKYGVEIRGCLASRIFGNTFVDNGGMSIYVNQNNDTHISANSIAWNNSSTLSDEGIFVENSNNTRIIRNIYKRAIRPLSFHGLNPQVKIHCNTFYDPTATIYAAISVFNNPINDQGYPGYGANNDFSGLPPSTLRVRNNVGPVLTFTNTPGATFANAPSVNTNFLVNALYLSNCNIPKLAQDIETEEILENYVPTPNPFTDVLNVSENLNSVQIFSTSGQLIETIQINSTELNLGHLDTGIYFMIFRDNQGELSRHKLVKN